MFVAAPEDSADTARIYQSRAASLQLHQHLSEVLTLE